MHEPAVVSTSPSQRMVVSGTVTNITPPPPPSGGGDWPEGHGKGEGDTPREPNFADDVEGEPEW